MRLENFKIKLSCRSVWHWVAGGLLPFTLFIHPSIPFLVFGMFLAYQIKQDKDNLIRGVRKPDSHLDIYELITPATIGFSIIGIIFFIRFITRVF